ncbi:MAG: GGDEF domain-containing protein [Thermodesulfobacteriota bacterium]
MTDKNTPPMKRTSEEHVLLTVCVVGTLGIAPFAVCRFIGQEWLLGTIDSFIVTTMVVLGLFAWHKKRVRLASILLSVCSMAGLFMVVHLGGPSLIYWAYPVMATVFFLLTQREAIIIDLLAMAALAPAIQPHMANMEFAGILVNMVLIMVFAYIFADRTRHQRQQLALLATEDSLTGAGNRRAFDAKLNEILAAKPRTRQPVSLLALDLDHFKSINDTYGHETGDEILCKITSIIQERIRVSDGLYRIGGEEFVVIAVGANLSDGARKAEQLRLLVGQCGLLADRPVTISLGVAEINEGETGTECLRRADNALYEAKRAGRNTIRTDQWPESPW